MKLYHLIESENSLDHLPSEVSTWLKKHVKNLKLKNSSYFLFENGELNVHKEFKIILQNISDADIPPWKFGKVGEMDLDDTNSFTKLDFLPYYLEYNLRFDFKLSLKGIHKRVKNCKILYVGKDITSGLLDILKIESIRGGITGGWSGGASSVDPDFRKAFLFVKFGYEDGEDIFDVQDKFIDAGLERFL